MLQTDFVKIKLIDLVSGTYGNTSGYTLYAVIKSVLAGGDQISSLLVVLVPHSLRF